MRRLSVLIPPVIILILCNGCYLAKQGTGLLGYQFRTVPINKMLRDSSTAPETKEFLNRVLDIRSFAIDSLGLKRNKNYLKYVHAGRDYMVDVLVACKDDTFDLYKWWFPITGSVPYKGFFDRKDAEKEAKKITKKGGYDITIGKADAFSTLGITADPIYSFMAEYSVYDLASLIIHEQTHATVFIKSQIQLNEEMATFVGDVGGLLYVKSKFGEDSDQYRAAVLSKEDYRTYISLMRELYDDLRAVYAQDSSREYKLAEKARVFGSFRSNIANSYDSLFRTQRYKGLKQADLNNAVIASRMTYNLDMSLYYSLYEKRGRDMAAVVRDLKGLKKVKKEHKEYLRKL
ncbi:MAG: aminopeptidase [Chitinispirillia bacterium]|nr:aminopeptidase [Chitinispirillia bacterium]MCL2242810.1 aminopeptidase [Chitinispirillia bacterium]